MDIKRMTILSPNYPHYRKYSDCEWVLIVPCNKQIELHFEEFEIEKWCPWPEAGEMMEPALTEQKVDGVDQICLEPGLPPMFD